MRESFSGFNNQEARRAPDIKVLAKRLVLAFLLTTGAMSTNAQSTGFGPNTTMERGGGGGGGSATRTYDALGGYDKMGVNITKAGEAIKASTINSSKINELNRDYASLIGSSPEASLEVIAKYRARDYEHAIEIIQSEIDRATASQLALQRSLSYADQSIAGGN